MFIRVTRTTDPAPERRFADDDSVAANHSTRRPIPTVPEKARQDMEVSTARAWESSSREQEKR
jgi:hypothetical protein